MINWSLIKEPWNWVTVVLMTVIGLVALDLILHPYAKSMENEG